MGMISDIQRASVHDGPGIRTTVFFKGCPLHCRWCHNPECISAAPQMMYYPSRCIGCGHCDEGCYSGARVLCGREMTPQEVLAEVMQDTPYYGETGGVTFSGGEPMAQMDFLKALIRACKEKKIRTGIETSLYFFDAEILRETDDIMVDFKLFDDDLHKAYTGVSNRRIIAHFKALDAMGIPYLVRTPLIPHVTDTEKIDAFVKTLRHKTGHEYLPYHPLGFTKAAALGIKQERFDQEC